MRKNSMVWNSLAVGRYDWHLEVHLENGNIVFYNWRTNGHPLEILNAKYKIDEKNTPFTHGMK